MSAEISNSRGRPAVSVVVPFAGSAEQAAELISAVRPLRLDPADELILVDNSRSPVLAAIAGESAVTVLEASAQRSSYYARNVGAAAAAGEWLLFVDADCRPSAGLLDAYSLTTVSDRVGALAGAVEPAGDQSGLLARWAASRRIISQAGLVEASGGAATANLMVRKQAWESVGGFQEGIRSGGDLEFCWRLADAGWELEQAPQAEVEHLHRTGLPAMIRQMARYAAGNSWQQRRRPASSPPPRLLRSLAGSLAGSLGYLLSLRFDRAGMKLVDCVAVTAQAFGRLGGNAAEGPRHPARRPLSPRKALVISCDYFPVLSETFVAADVESLIAAGWNVRVEAVARPERPRIGGTRGLDVHYLEDEGRLARLGALLWLATRHPLGSIADLRRRRAFSADERLPLRALASFARRAAAGGKRHLHAHFAAMASVNALRVGAILRLPVSFAAHAHEIYVRPRDLPQKLDRAAFAVADCQYTLEHLRSMVDGATAARVHEIVLGVDTERFRRRSAYPGACTVIAVGRLVEKKGFEHLISATAELPEVPGLRVLIAGDGPLRQPLGDQIAGLGLEDRVRLLGSLEPEAVRELLETADLLCMPCVIAANGDRDSMPVVVKEALSMEVPVIASDEVGLPEIVSTSWGRLVPPADPGALAAAIRELLALSTEERIAMGRRGRTAVQERANLAIESAELARLIEEVAEDYH